VTVIKDLWKGEGFFIGGEGRHKVKASPGDGDMISIGKIGGYWRVSQGSEFRQT